MKRIFFVAIIAALVILSVNSLEAKSHGRGSRCDYGSENMSPIDGFIWTMANPNECGMEFYQYASRIERFVIKMSGNELESELVKKLMQKHVKELVYALKNEKPNSYEATFHEGYYEKIIFYENLGFKSGLNQMALLKFLHAKYKERCEDILKKLRKNKIPDSFLVLELERIMEKSGITIADLKTSRKELNSFLD